MAMLDLILSGFPHRRRGKVDGVVMVNLLPSFVASPGAANVKSVADHVEHIARIAGREQYVRLFWIILGEGLGSRSWFSVGIGSRWGYTRRSSGVLAKHSDDLHCYRMIALNTDSKG
jgi:hypothetical protein